MRKYMEKTTNPCHVIICNKCGKKIDKKDGLQKEEVFHGEVRWGYFSNKDGETHTFDLCEACYDEWIRSFQIPVEIKEETELL
ncbi:MAG TPA: hypothetical protein DCZ20_09295 [Lachnospiraceae bacterium]|nr:hypothetical protein [Lachnospiraceae bacterium]